MGLYLFTSMCETKRRRQNNFLLYILINVKNANFTLKCCRRKGERNSKFCLWIIYAITGKELSLLEIKNRSEGEKKSRQLTNERQTQS